MAKISRKWIHRVLLIEKS